MFNEAINFNFNQSVYMLAIQLFVLLCSCLDIVDTILLCRFSYFHLELGSAALLYSMLLACLDQW